jgi:hypothetical protein
VRALPVEDDHVAAAHEHLHGDQLGKDALARPGAGRLGDVRRVVAQAHHDRLAGGAQSEEELPLGELVEAGGEVGVPDPGWWAAPHRPGSSH